MSAPIGGFVAPGFEAVRSAFEGNFADRGEVGAAVHVIVEGEVVVDLVGGWTDETKQQAWRHDTLEDFYSTGKALLGLLVLQLVDTGVVSLDQPIADVWPEFAAGGKGATTVAHALTHRAGVPAIRERLTDDDLFDWQRMTDAVAATDAWYPPGKRLVYHTNTFGHLVGELIHRATGEMPGDRLRTVARELDADVWFGLPTLEQARCADVIWAPANPIPIFDSYDGLEGDLLLNALAHVNPPGYSSMGVVNTPEWRAMQLGSTSGHGTAAGVAKVYAGLLEHGRLLSPALLATATTALATGHCPILNDEITYGYAFQPTTPRRSFGPNPRSFGHFGTGGAVGFADPETGVAFGYVMNHVIPRWQSSRNRSLIAALYDSLA